MRELEFLPGWYPRLRWRRRLMRWQLYLSLVLLLGLGMGMVRFNAALSNERQRVGWLSDKLKDTRQVLAKLDELEKLDTQLKTQQRVVEKIGLHVEATRIVNALEGAMSKDMSLLNLSMEVFEQQRKPASLKELSATVASSAGKEKAPPLVDRTLKVKVQGVAPTDVELGNFLNQLRNNSLFETVNMNYARERAQNGHAMREFEVLFSVNLNTQD